MKIIAKEHHIPESTYLIKIYIASDGKEFASEDACLRHEKRLEIENHPIYITAIKGAYSFEEGYGATLYYFSSNEDYEYFKETQGIDIYHFDSDFDEYGVGWYIYWCEDGGDYPDDYYLKNYDAYENDIESRWNEYKQDMRYKIEQKSK